MTQDSSSRARKPEPEPAVGSSIDPPRNFHISLEERVRALAGGAPAYAIRKRRIEDAIDRFVVQLSEIRDALELAGATRERIRTRLTERAKRFDLTKTNALIEAHNRYFPIEANLPIDPATGGYLSMGRPWKKEPLLTADALIERALATTDGD